MGSCISKCRHKHKHKHKPIPPPQTNLVQDKLVISQVSSLSIDLPKKPSLSSSCSFSLSSSSTPASTPTTSTNSTITTVNSSEKVFSDEFLWSCIKENLHILPVDPVKLSPVKPTPIKPQSPKPEPLKKPITTTPRQSIPSSVRPKQSVNSHSNSPSLGRQKSFRRDQSSGPLPKRNLSPSTSQRFSGDSNAGLSKQLSKQKSRRKDGDVDNGVCRSVPARKENLRSPRPCEAKRQNGYCVKKRESIVHKVTQENKGSCVKKIETFVQEIPPREDTKISKDFPSQRDINCPTLEDLNNPLISLDCFIFL